MKKLLLTAAFAVLFAAPSFAEDAAPAPVEAAPAVEAAAPAPEAAAAAAAEAHVAPADAVADATKEACTAETNEKVKLPENAGDAEKAQWDAAFAECVKGKGAAEAPAAEAAPAATEEAPAAH